MRFGLFVLTLRYTGMRIRMSSRLTGLEVGDGEVTVKTKKTGVLVRMASAR